MQKREHGTTPTGDRVPQKLPRPMPPDQTTPVSSRSKRLLTLKNAAGTPKRVLEIRDCDKVMCISPEKATAAPELMSKSETSALEAKLRTLCEIKDDVSTAVTAYEAFRMETDASTQDLLELTEDLEEAKKQAEAKRDKPFVIPSTDCIPVELNAAQMLEDFRKTYLNPKPARTDLEGKLFELEQKLQHIQSREKEFEAQRVKLLLRIKAQYDRVVQHNDILRRL